MGVSESRLDVRTRRERRRTSHLVRPCWPNVVGWRGRTERRGCSIRGIEAKRCGRPTVIWKRKTAPESERGFFSEGRYASGTSCAFPFPSETHRLRFQLNRKARVHVALDRVGEFKNLRARRAAAIHQHQRLPVVNGGGADRTALPATSVN